MISSELRKIAFLIEAKGTLSFKKDKWIFRFKAVWGEGGGKAIDDELKEYGDKLKSDVKEFDKNIEVSNGTVANSHYGMMAEIYVTGVKDNKKFSEYMKNKNYKVKG